eukprot:1077177-Alexandrium_andersonii.AAC.1
MVGHLAKHDMGNAAALQLSARHKTSTSAASITMPLLDKIDRAFEPLANAAVALAAAVFLRYTGWLR